MSEVDEVLALYDPDMSVVERGKMRQDAIWQGKAADSLPILVEATARPEKSKFPDYNLKECYYDREKMLISHLWQMIGYADSRSDAVPSIRANTGVGTVATVFGCTNRVFEDKMPWVTEHLGLEEALAVEVDNVAARGVMPMVLEYMEYFHEKLDGRGYVYCSDTQGPLDVAHIVRGDGLLTDLRDEPEKVHMLLEKCSQVIIEAVKAMKEVVGEPLDRGYHDGSMYMGAGGVRICEDTTTLLSPRDVREFAVPYTRRVCAAFGGGWVHFCGTGGHVMEALLEAPEVKGFNFGNPELFDDGQVLRTLTGRGKFYMGIWHRSEGESLENYFRKALQPLDGKAIGIILQPVLAEDEQNQPEEVIQLWRRLQQEG